MTWRFVMIDDEGDRPRVVTGEISEVRFEPYPIESGSAWDELAFSQVRTAGSSTRMTADVARGREYRLRIVDGPERDAIRRFCADIHTPPDIDDPPLRSRPPEREVPHPPGTTATDWVNVAQRLVATPAAVEGLRSSLDELAASFATVDGQPDDPSPEATTYTVEYDFPAETVSAPVDFPGGLYYGTTRPPGWTAARSLSAFIEDFEWSRVAYHRCSATVDRQNEYTLDVSYFGRDGTELCLDHSANHPNLPSTLNVAVRPTDGDTHYYTLDLYSDVDDAARRIRTWNSDIF